MTDALSISVIVPTWNRRELVREAVESLWRQTLPHDRYEIIVVDNCSTDGTGEMFAGLAAQSPCALTYHRMPENGGPVRSRNAGAGLARAPLLAFTDSDCRVAPDWLERALAAAAAGSSASVFAGLVRNKPDQPVRFFSVGSVSGEEENPIYPTCNIVYRRDIFEQLRGFDEAVHLRDAGGAPLECSDADLAWRAKEAGFLVAFVPDMIVYHEVREATPFDWLAAHLRFVWVPELIRRHAGMRRFLLWWGPFCLADNLLFYIACAGLALAFAANPWWALAAAPFLVRMSRVVAAGFSLARLPKAAVQMGFLCLRQACICGALLYGSIRARRLVL